MLNFQLVFRQTTSQGNCALLNMYNVSHCAADIVQNKMASDISWCYIFEMEAIFNFTISKAANKSYQHDNKSLTKFPQVNYFK